MVANEYHIKSVEEVHQNIKDRYREETGQTINGPLITKSGTFDEPDLGIDMNRREVRGIVSTSGIDNDNEVVIPSGLDRSYFPNQVKTVYYGHNDERPIGACRDMWLTKNGRCLRAVTYIAKTALGDDMLQMIRDQVINGFSITFLPMDFGEPTHKETADYGRGKSFRSIVRTGKLFDYVITPRPCNGEALVEMVEKALSGGLIRRESAAVFTGGRISPNPLVAVRSKRFVPIVSDDGTVVYAGRR